MFAMPFQLGIMPPKKGDFTKHQIGWYTHGRCPQHLRCVPNETLSVYFHVSHVSPKGRLKLLVSTTHGRAFPIYVTSYPMMWEYVTTFNHNELERLVRSIDIK